jgi:hypothetical protein
MPKVKRRRWLVMPAALSFGERLWLWGWDADGLGSAGFDGAAGDGLGGFVEADFDGG